MALYLAAGAMAIGSYAIYSLANRKYVAPETKQELTVAGYIRRMQSIDYKKEQMPLDIVSLICMYYCNVEYFTKHGSSIRLNEEKTLATVNSNDIYTQGSVFGNYPIKARDNVKYEWRFEIKEMGTFVGIGIDSSNRKFVEKYFYDGYNNKSPWYAYEIPRSIANEWNLKYNNGYKYCNQKRDVAYGYTGNKHDIIKMELNLKNDNKTLKFYHNEKDCGIAFDNIVGYGHITYYLAIYLQNGSAIKFIDFKKS